MINRYFYRVAELTFSVAFPFQVDVDERLRSMQPFRIEEPKDEVVFEALVEDNVVEGLQRGELLEECINDMGCVRIESLQEGFLVSLSHQTSPYIHYLLLGNHSKSIRLQIDMQDRLCWFALSSLLRVAYSQQVVYHKGISIHSSAVYWTDEAYMFLGQSGTGKSTHARQWMKAFEGCALLNDDNPTIRIVEGRAKVYGTPWSGKTPCYKNLCFPLRGVARLKQAKVNQFTELRGMEAFLALLPSGAVLRFDSVLHDMMCDTLIELISLINVGRMECLPDEEAARVCYEELKK